MRFGAILVGVVVVVDASVYYTGWKGTFNDKADVLSRRLDLDIGDCNRSETLLY